MSSIDYINGLAARGIHLWVQDGKLQYKAPKEAITPQLLGELKQHKPVLIALLEQFAGSAGAYPLSYSQKSLWSLHQLNPASPAYNVTYAARLADTLDRDALARCFDYLIARHAILRTRYSIADGQPRQQVGHEANARLVVERAFDASEAAILEWVDTESNRPFDLAVSPVRVKLLVNEASPGNPAPRHVLLLNVHHIALDLWSLEIFVRELRSLYQLATRGEPLKLPPLAMQYKDCVQQEAERLQGAEGKALAAFWEQELQGPLPVLELATDRLRPPVKTENGRIHTLPLGEALTRSVKDAAKALHVTPYMLLLSVYQLFLHLHTGQRRLLVGAPTAGRNAPGSEHVLGHFVNAVVLSCELRDGDRFADVLARTRTMTLRALDHQDYPFPLLVEKLRPPRDTSRSPVFQVMYNWNQARGSDAHAGDDGLIVSMLAASGTGTHGATHDLTLNLQDHGAEYHAAWTYNTDLFDAPTIARYAAQYVALVEQVLVDATLPLARYRLAPAAWRTQVLEEVARVARSAEPSSPLPAAFAARVRAQPQQLVWQIDDRPLRLADVAQAVDALRATLAGHGVHAGSRVAVDLRSVPELAVAMLALLDLGANVVLVDPSGQAPAAVPAPDALIAGGGASWAAWAPDTIAVRGDGRAAPVVDRDGGASACQIGCFIEGIGQLLDLSDERRVLLPAGTDLRLGLAAAVCALACGGVLRLSTTVSVAGLVSGEATAALADLIAEERIAGIALPSLLLPTLPSLDRLDTVLAYGDHPHPVAQAARRRKQPAALRHLPSFCLQSWAGPLAFHAGPQGWQLLPLAGPYPHPVVLGRFDDLADLHQSGRLCLLAERNADAQASQATAARFAAHGDLSDAFVNHRIVDTPIAVTPREGGELACITPATRVALQRGVAVPVGLVEALIALHPQVEEVACELLDGALVAWVRADADGEDALKRHLKQSLSDTMQPRAFVFVERLPLRADGTLDVARLPAPVARGTDGDAPSTDVEQRLAAVWCEVLSRPAVGLHDDFFDLGGDSILAAVIVSKAGAEGLYLQPKDVFEHTTIAALARAVNTTPQVQVEQGSVAGEVVPGPAPAWFFERIGTDLGHFNQGLLVALNEAPDAACMDEALRLLAQQHDVLRSRFVQREGAWRHVFEAGGDAPRLQHVRCADEAAWQAAIAAAQSGFALDQAPLWTVRWLDRGTPASSRLLIAVHHLLIDGVSWNVLLQDLSDFYSVLQRGGALAPPRKTSSYKAWVEQLAARLQGGALQQEAAYWQRFAAQVAPPPVLPPGASAGAGEHRFALDAELTAAFRGAAHQAYGTDPNDLLLAALHEAFAAWSGPDAPLLLDLEGHGRDAVADGIDLGRSIGWFTSIYPVQLAPLPGADTGRRIKAVKERLREIPAKGAAFGVLRYLGADPALAALPRSPLLFTYLGSLDQMVGRTALYSGVAEPAPHIRSTRQARTHTLELCAYITRGQLTLECLHERATVSDEAVRALMAQLEAALGRVIRHCASGEAGGLTPSDVPQIDIDQDGLDALLEEVAALDR